MNLSFVLCPPVTTSLLSNATNSLQTALTIYYGQLSDHTCRQKLISFDSVITALKRCGNQNILQMETHANKLTNSDRGSRL